MRVPSRYHANDKRRFRNVTSKALALVALSLFATVYVNTLLRAHGVLRRLYSASLPEDKVDHAAPPEDLTSLASSIARKWGLVSPNAVHLLQRQFSWQADYDRARDFLHFHHLAKTGGTSISDLMKMTLVGDANRTGILPGSQRSGPFKEADFYATTGLKNASDETVGRLKLPYVASYGHTRLRPVHGPHKTELASFFDDYFTLLERDGDRPRRSIRSLAMIREPTDLRASTMAMALCSLNGKVIEFNRIRAGKGLGPICTPREGLNISSFVDQVVRKAKGKCRRRKTNEDDLQLDRYERIICNRGGSALDFCRSPGHLLQSQIYKQGMSSMYRPLMARYVQEEGMGTVTTFRSVESSLIDQGIVYSDAKVEDYTLIDLGGLDPNRIDHMPYEGYKFRRKESRDGKEPDFVWFGITERMKDSTCLFAYTLRVMPVAEPPRERVMKCPPTSWWTEAHREMVKKKSPADYAVWRAANAIMDVRVFNMKQTIQRQLERKAMLSSEQRRRFEALESAGCLSL